MPWLGTDSVRIEVPEGWPCFTGTGRVYAHSPDCRAGFVFTVLPVSNEESLARSVDEDKLTSFLGEGIGRYHDPFARGGYQAPIPIERSAPVVRGEYLGCPTLSRSGSVVSSGDTIGFAVTALHAPTRVPPFIPGDARFVENAAAAMVVATSLDGPEAALRLATGVASSCLRAPDVSPGTLQQGIPWPTRRW